MIKILGHCVRPVVAIAAVVLLLTAGLVVRLYYAPLSLSPIAPLIDARIARALPELDIDFEEPFAVWNREAGTLELAVRNVTIRDMQGAYNISLPRVSAAFSVNALMNGRIAPSRAELTGSELHFDWRATAFEDAIERAMAGETSGESVLARMGGALAGVVNEFLAGAEPGSGLEYLEEVQISRTEILLTELETGTVWLMPDARLRLAREGRARFIELAAQMEAGGESPFLRMDIRSEESSAVQATFRIEDFNPASLSAEVGLAELWAAFDFSWSGELMAGLTPSGGLQSLDFDLSAPGGMLHFADAYESPPVFSNPALSGRFDVAAQRLELSSFFMNLGTAAVEGEGALDFAAGPRPAVTLFGEVRNLGIRKLLEYWPPAFGPGGRRWIDANMEAALVEEGQFTVNLDPDDYGVRPLPDDVFRLDFRYSGAVAHVLRGLPPIERGTGRATLIPSTLTLHMDSGTVAGMRMEPGMFEAFDLNIRGQAHGRARVNLIGGVEALLRFIDNDPLNLARKFGLAPDRLQGQAFAHGDFRLPLVRPRLEDVNFNVTAEVENFAAPDLFTAGGIENGSLSLQVDRDGITAAGPVELKGVPVEMNWRQAFGITEEEETNTWFAINAPMNAEALAAFGIPAAPFVEGPVEVSLDLEGRGFELRRGQASVDLAPARITVPRLGWVKDTGRPGALDFGIAWQSDRINITGIRLAAGEAILEGTMVLDRDGSFVRAAHFPRIRMPGADIAASLLRTSGNRVQLSASGRYFDASPFITDILQPDSGNTRLPLLLEVTVDEVTALNGLTLRNAGITLDRTAAGVRQASVTALLEGDKSLSLELTEAGDGNRRLEILSGDAGSVARAAGIFTNGTGGTLNFTANMNPLGAPNHVEGRIRIDDSFRLVRSSALVEALESAEGRNFDDMIGEGGITFSEVRIPFVLDNGIVDVRNARASGPALGFTMEGQMDLVLGDVNLNGVIVPAYALNSLLSAVPIVGDILMGGEGQGLFGVTYRVEGGGGAEDPDVSINPMSALAPGFLRRIFEGPRGTLDMEGREERLREQSEEETGNNTPSGNGGGR